ncbi:MAG: thiol-disulfide oxidoreductase DCC family protein [Flavobacteriales bacterium]
MNPILLFDGNCSFCNKSVQFILEKEKRKTFLFASLQSEIGKKLLTEHKVPDYIDSIVLIKNGKAYWNSSAALRITKHLKGGYPLLQGLLIIPFFIRDFFYKLIAKNRQKLIKDQFCIIPSDDDKKRIILK